MPKKKAKGSEEQLKRIQILLAGLLLKEEPRPKVTKLARYLEVSDATIMDLFPQRQKKTRKSKSKAKKGVTQSEASNVALA